MFNFKFPLGNTPANPNRGRPGARHGWYQLARDAGLNNLDWLNIVPGNDPLFHIPGQCLEQPFSAQAPQQAMQTDIHAYETSGVLNLSQLEIVDLDHAKALCIDNLRIQNIAPQ